MGNRLISNKTFILVFCANPGPLFNGRIYVILKDERISSIPIRSEFRSYIPNVGHGRTIEFECNSGNLRLYFSISIEFFLNIFRLCSSWSIRINM